MEKVRWFACPGCDRVVPGCVRDLGPKNVELISRTHCCRTCEAGGGGHNADWWCAGTPRHQFHSVELPCRDRYRRPLVAHYILHLPDSPGPLPALLFLHGGATYMWPETLAQEVDSLVATNPVARTFIIIAPFATKGEPLAERSQYRWIKDRYENSIRYVDAFDTELTLECYTAACRRLGPGVVDLARLCITGYSMGAQAAWDLARQHGTMFSAIAPLAGRMVWPPNGWRREEQAFCQLRDLAVWAFSVATDETTYNASDFTWLAEKRGLPIEPTTNERERLPFGPEELESRIWDDNLRLFLIHGSPDAHNCWDYVWRNEPCIGLFRWLATRRKSSVAASAAAAAVLSVPWERSSGRRQYADGWADGWGSGWAEPAGAPPAWRGGMDKGDAWAWRGDSEDDADSQEDAASESSPQF
mmetsp:Transcript_23844/g.69013  ORF Transcript_23844/g.69013 Transcript_23844/m.69013 type:complete len:416 (-) Transcript_23844:61-1308(-)